LSWSPDERFFAYVDALARSSQITQIRLLRVSGGTDIVVTDGRSNDWSPSWSEDGRFLYFVSNREGGMDLWRQPLDEHGTMQSSPERITTGFRTPSAVFSPDGSRLAYRLGTNVSNIWRIPILQDRPATWGDARQVTFEQAYIQFLDLSPDGDRWMVSSDRSGNFDLWMISIEDGTMQQLTTDPTPDWGPRWSPDGKEIAFYAYRSGTGEIWVMPVDFGSARQITFSETESRFPVWSPDGRRIVFGSRESGNYDIWSVSADGGELRQLTTDQAPDYFPAWSPDGRWLAFRSMRDGTARIWRMPAEGGTPERLTQISSWAPVWSPDGTRIFFASPNETDQWDIWEVSLEDGAERAVTDLAGRRGRLGSACAPVTDGQYLYFSWIEEFGDIWVMDVVRE
jgi:Tol biopolymer transport system component